MRAVFLACALGSCAPPGAPGPEPLDASRFNGTWVMIDEGPYRGELKLWALDERTLRVEFEGAYTFGTAAGRMADLRAATGAATVEGDAASFAPEESETGCTITLRLQGQGWMRVNQGGSCLGRYVRVAGRYQRIDRDRPWFGAPAPPG